MQNKLWLRMVLLAFVFAVTAQVHAAKTPSVACKLCDQIENVRALLKTSEAQARQQGIRLLGQSDLSKNPEIRRREIKAVLNLAVILIPQDDAGASAEYLYAFYNEAPQDFEKEIPTLPAKSQKLIRKSLKNVAELNKNGNG